MEQQQQTKVKQGYVAYNKDNQVQEMELPKYGEITLIVQNGEVKTVKRTETHK